MAEPVSGLHFQLMALAIRLRDVVLPPGRVLAEVGLQPGWHVLDYGCGPGSYTLPAARLVGEAGLVHALDVHPLAIASVERLTARRGLANVRTVLSDCDTGLADGEVDAVLLYDVVHRLSDLGRVLAELRRVLKPGGVLSASDHHLGWRRLEARLTEGGLFAAGTRARRSQSFTPV